MKAKLSLKERRKKTPSVYLWRSRKQLVKALDEAMSEFVRYRDKKCVVCGSTEKLTNGHLFTRNAYSTRWDYLNSNCQCWPCNYLHERDPYPYTNWFLETYGKEVYDALHKRFSTPQKFSNVQLTIKLREIQEDTIALLTIVHKRK